jgi:hypothetical protein
MTLEELQVKFDTLAEPVMSEDRRAERKDAIFALETLDDVGKLMALTIA